jgi:hypothetical protein
MPPHANSYAFGDGDRAARRRRGWSRRSSTTRRMRSCAAVPRSSPPGGGSRMRPGGHTTRLLHEATASARTVGIDSSEYFLAMASRTGEPGLRLARHDVQSVPFPAGPACGRSSSNAGFWRIVASGSTVSVSLQTRGGRRRRRSRSGSPHRLTGDRSSCSPSGPFAEPPPPVR